MMHIVFLNFLTIICFYFFDLFFSIQAHIRFFSLLSAGPQTFPNRVYSFLDVRDVAYAHIQAFEVASASGRYCLGGCVAHISEPLKILQKLYPTLRIPER